LGGGIIQIDIEEELPALAGCRTGKDEQQSKG